MGVMETEREMAREAEAVAALCPSGSFWVSCSVSWQSWGPLQQSIFTSDQMQDLRRDTSLITENTHQQGTTLRMWTILTNKRETAIFCHHLSNHVRPRNKRYCNSPRKKIPVRPFHSVQALTHMSQHHSTPQQWAEVTATYRLTKTSLFRGFSCQTIRDRIWSSRPTRNP